MTAYFRLACRACLVSLVQTLGVAVTAAHSPLMWLTGFAIAYVWSGNVRAMANGSRAERIAYGLGGAVGAGITWLLWR